ncbi:hypothetical protein McanMca71_000597 [Microsporum canis]|uniref:Uncharacterized protein n=1 Tax=Arthroderma otae (strain ATCC MYA-4605 / CBS 113480) TaxID=554155 RepID=C5FLZ5_ARTOC|nr:uncharacterized protein MCYG_03536 [Microsporum canis CBS 113480]EEQ30717.1 predicted protein [Microsporum canis CBS 113480]
MPSLRQSRAKPVQCTAAYRYLTQFLQAGPMSLAIPTSPRAGYIKDKNVTTITTLIENTGSKDASDIPLLIHSPAATVISADDSPITPSSTGPEDKFTFLQDDMIESKVVADLAPVIVDADKPLLESTQ